MWLIPHSTTSKPIIRALRVLIGLDSSQASPGTHTPAGNSILAQAWAFRLFVTCAVGEPASWVGLGATLQVSGLIDGQPECTL